jgi:hypothetical protein
VSELENNNVADEEVKEKERPEIEELEELETLEEKKTEDGPVIDDQGMGDETGRRGVGRDGRRMELGGRLIMSTFLYIDGDKETGLIINRTRLTNEKVE